MTPSAGIVSVLFGLGAAVSWGVGDFSGGVASRRVPIFIVLLFTQLTGLLTLLALAAISDERQLTLANGLVGASAGISGAIGLLALYSAMARGLISLVAPITSVVGTGIPVLFAALTEGLPGAITSIGFLLALVGIWLISQPHGASRGALSQALALAVGGGIAFGVFYILMGQIEGEALYLPLTAARLTTISLTLIYLLQRRQLAAPPRGVLPIIVLSGIVDSLGNAFFVLSEQAGRLDITTVLSALYPVVTVGLAVIILKERLQRAQGVGVALILLAIPLIASA